MSRLSFAPKTDRMEVTDIRTGHFIFPPKPGEPVSFAALTKAITGAGYEIEKSWIEVTGELRPRRRLRAFESAQIFDLAGGEALDRLAAELRPGDVVSVFGEWRAGEEGDAIVVERHARGEAPVDEKPPPGHR